ncbi:MAG: tRNA (adenosine(37)-N6)-threonylcarbamoyltransferase complex dimerization subunit type 1 TsaB [Lachnospiraceae bacterium]
MEHTIKILAIDSSSLVASVAIIENDICVAEYTTNFKRTHSQTLVPMLEEVKKMIELELDTIDAIALTKGPGSFTGLRIGASTAIGLSHVLKKPIIGIGTIEALAYNLYGSKDMICPIMDARRNQTYTGLYEFVTENFEEKFEVILEQSAMMIEELIEKINEINRPVVFLGDGVPVFKEQLMQKITVPVKFAPAHCNRQRAASVGALAMEYYKEGKYVEAGEFRPEYLRKSQAERERECLK